MNGNIYFTDTGNASGSFVTTILNCHVVAKTTLYTFCKRFYEESGLLPSYKEIGENIIIRGLGDDAIRKVRSIFKRPLTQEDFIRDAECYKLTQTPAKTEGEISFCSREYVKYNNVYFPRLKKDSITSCLFWYANLTPEQVYQNCFTALMEAGLWDEEFYTTITKTVIELQKHFKFDFDIASYTLIQQCWYNYIIGKRNTPVWGRSDPESIIEETYSNSEKRFLKMADMWLNEYVQKMKLDQPIYQYTAEGPDESLIWSCEASILEGDKLFTGTGTGNTKSESKREACENIKQSIEGVQSNAEIELLCYKHEGKEYHVGECQKERKKTTNVFNNHTSFLRHMAKNYPAINFMNKESRKQLMGTRCFTSIRTAIEGYLHQHILPNMRDTINKFADTLTDKDNINDEQMAKLDELLSTMEKLEVRANMGDTPIEPAVMNQAMAAQNVSDLPAHDNPQPTATAPAVTGPGDDIMAALQFAQESTLNPMGAPNMLSVGAIGFDIKTIAYTQFLDCDTEFSTTESAPTGSIIFQIPYAVISRFTNYYIQRYAALHERYTGALKFRITAIGNQLLSGAVGVCWSEKRIQESTILISEAQKISYEMKGVNNPFNQIHYLHDARQTKFYRRVAEDVTDDLDERPHLVVFVGMNIYNPYRDNTLVRFRVASRLANSSEPNPFYFALPIRGDTTGGFPSPVAPPRPLNDAFPHITNYPMYIYTDGLFRTNTDYIPGIRYPIYDPNCLNGATTRYISNETPSVAYTTTCTGHYFTDGLAVAFPRIEDFWNNRGTPVETSQVAIISQTTMNSENFAILCAGCRYPGFGVRPANTVPTEDDWNFMKIAGGWLNSSIPILPPNDIQILAILYNDVQEELSVEITGDGITARVMRSSQIKVITNHGTSVFYLIATGSNGADEISLGKIAGLATLWDPPLSAQAKVTNLAPFPFRNLDLELGDLVNFTALPLGYQALRFSNIPPSSITIENYPGPTATDDPIIERWFYERAKDIPVTSCIEFIIADRASQRILLTARYLQDQRIFVINAETPNYRASPNGSDELQIQNISTVPRTNGFNLTDTSLWFNRTDARNFSRLTTLNPLKQSQIVKANMAAMAAAAIGGSALSGLGQGMAGWFTNKAQMKQQKEMQAELFAHEDTMQGNMFNQQNLFQNNQFGHEQRMALMNQDFQKLLQNNRFGQESRIIHETAEEQRLTNREASINRLVERGLGTRVNFMNGQCS